MVPQDPIDVALLPEDEDVTFLLEQKVGIAVQLVAPPKFLGMSIWPLLDSRTTCTEEGKAGLTL